MSETTWPDDFSSESIEGTARQMLQNFYRAEGGRLATHPNMQPAPHEVRVLNSANQIVHRVNVIDLAKFMGLAPL